MTSSGAPPRTDDRDSAAPGSTASGQPKDQGGVVGALKSAVGLGASQPAQEHGSSNATPQAQAAFTPGETPKPASAEAAGRGQNPWTTEEPRH